MQTFIIGLKGFPFPEMPATVQATRRSEAMTMAAKIYNSSWVKVKEVDS